MRSTDIDRPCVLLLAFNRPVQMRRVLESLRVQEIGKLIVFVDGPRDDRDVSSVAQCRALAERINWVETDLRFRETNHGLPAAADAITSVLAEHESAVIVEDDCLPMPGFYRSMQNALAHYASAGEVFGIGGYQPLPPSAFRGYPYSYMSSYRFICWGWATWRDRWKRLEPYRIGFAESFDGLTKVPDLAGKDIGPAAQAVALGHLKTWDIPVAIAMLRTGQVMMLPVAGLIRNIGLTSGTHGQAGSHPGNNPNVLTGEPSREVRWPETLTPDESLSAALRGMVSPIASGTEPVETLLGRIPGASVLLPMLRALRFRSGDAVNREP